MGADSPDKQELESTLLVSNKVVVDVLEQCAEVGELHHALESGLITTKDVHGQLGEIVAGMKPGRTSRDEITIFDSTGTVLQDVAVSAAAYRTAIVAGVGTFFDFMSVS
jgi:ornithine cyclodeaminase/alanine dehydrogenase